jgi:hypothetical protein
MLIFKDNYTFNKKLHPIQLFGAIYIYINLFFVFHPRFTQITFRDVSKYVKIQ